MRRTMIWLNLLQGSTILLLVTWVVSSEAWISVDGEKDSIMRRIRLFGVTPNPSDVSGGSAGLDKNQLDDAQRLKECRETAKIENASIRCVFSGCRLVCENGYKMPSGEKYVNLFCDQATGSLVLNGRPWRDVAPKCQPECGAGCKNGGVCVAPKECQCQDGYTGRYCDKEPCAGILLEARNAETVASKGVMVVNCLKNHHLSSGATTLTVKCVNGLWEQQEGGLNCYSLKQPCKSPDFPVGNVDYMGSQEKLDFVCRKGYAMESGAVRTQVLCVSGRWVAPPEGITCQAQCLPACGNGGTCISPGICECRNTHWGHSCEKLRCVFPWASSGHAILMGSLTSLKVACRKGYLMPSEIGQVTVTCDQGNWTVPGDPKQIMTLDNVNCFPVASKGKVSK